jgi:hypothetical protein
MQDGFILVLQGLLCSAERNGGRGVEKENKAGNGNARGRVARLISRSTSGYKIKELTFILFVPLLSSIPDSSYPPRPQGGLAISNVSSSDTAHPRVTHNQSLGRRTRRDGPSVFDTTLCNDLRFKPQHSQNRRACRAQGACPPRDRTSICRVARALCFVLS